MKWNFKKILLLFFPLIFLLPVSVQAEEQNIDGATLYTYQSTLTDGTAFLRGTNGIIYPAGADKIDKVYIFFHGLNPPCSDCHLIDPSALCKEFKICQKVAVLGNIAILFPQMDPQSGNHADAFTENSFDRYINEALAELHSKVQDAPNSISVVMGHGEGSGIIEKYLDYFSTDKVIIFNGCINDWCDNIFPSNKITNKYVYLTSAQHSLEIQGRFQYHQKSGDKKRSLWSMDHYQIPEKCFLDHIINDACKSVEQPVATKLDILLAQLNADKPLLAIDFPGLKFASSSLSTEETGDTYVIIPWIAQFISVLYKFALGVVSIVAVVMLIIQGVTIVSGGFISKTIKEGGKDVTVSAFRNIGKILMGLLIAWGSFAILYNINPNLVEFNALKVQVVQREDIDKMDFDKTPGYTGEAGSTEYTGPAPSAPQLDALFQAYASCYGLDQGVLKAVAAAESGLKPFANPGKKYQGLFQMDKPYCEGGLALVQYPPSLFLSCENRIEPETNTAAAAATINRNLQRIKNKCPQISYQDGLLLLYVAHNNGPGVMNFVINNGGCQGDNIRLQVRRYYDLQPGGQRKGVDADYGEKKYRYGFKVVNYATAYGVTELYPDGAKNDALCPKSTGKRVLPL